MRHVVLDRNGTPYKIGEDVIIINPDHSQHDQIGQIYKLRNYDSKPRISVILECGNVYSCKPEDISYA